MGNSQNAFPFLKVIATPILKPETDSTDPASCCPIAPTSSLAKLVEEQLVANHKWTPSHIGAAELNEEVSATSNDCQSTNLWKECSTIMSCSSCFPGHLFTASCTVKLKFTVLSHPLPRSMVLAEHLSPLSPQ